jgi:hypothetical protein
MRRYDASFLVSAAVSYHQFTHPPRRGPQRLIHRPRGPQRLIHRPRRRGPQRLTQIPALDSGAVANQAPHKPTAAIAAADHFPTLRRNSRRFTESCSWLESPNSEDGSLSINRSEATRPSPLRRPTGWKNAWRRSATCPHPSWQLARCLLEK